MLLAVAVPILLAAFSAPLARLVVAHVSPRSALRTLLVTTVTFASMTVAALLLLAWSLIARTNIVAAQGPWRPGDVSAATRVPALVGWLAVAEIAALMIRVSRTIRSIVRDRRTLCDLHRAMPPTPGPLVVVDDVVPAAYALPAIHRHHAKIVATTGLQTLLNPAEHEAVLAHEAAHLSYHHRWIATVAQMCTAFNPLLRSIEHRLTMLIETCADSAAAQQVGASITARAIAITAIAHLDNPPAVRTAGFAISGSGPVASRVTTLLNPPIYRRWIAMTACVLSLSAVVSITYASRTTERTFEQLTATSQTHP